MTGPSSQTPHPEADLRELLVYYDKAFAQYGPVPQGVGWNSPQRQNERFRQLVRCFEKDNGFSVLDLGCGYGALFDYVEKSGKEFAYFGVDLCEPMIGYARARHARDPRCSFEIGSLPQKQFDYVVASGIFNMLCSTPRETWERYVFDTMVATFERCDKACAWNFLTRYSDADKMRAGHYYADPGMILDFCIKNLSMNVNLYHHYGIWDFTVHVLRQA